MRPDTEERFWAKVEKTDTCWLWTAYRNRGGYGWFSWRQDGQPRSGSAHRFAYELLVGPIPEGLDLDHLCRVRHCLNPDHLEPVTRVVNTRRGTLARRAQRTHCERGHPFTTENTYVKSDGVWRCRACQREAVRRYKARKRAKVG